MHEKHLVMIQICPAAIFAVNSADACNARGVSYLSMITSTNCIFCALANSSSSRSLSSSDLLRTVYDFDILPSRSPRVARSEAHFLREWLSKIQIQRVKHILPVYNIVVLPAVVRELSCKVFCLISDYSPI